VTECVRRRTWNALCGNVKEVRCRFGSETKERVEICFVFRSQRWLALTFSYRISPVNEMRDAESLVRKGKVVGLLTERMKGDEGPAVTASFQRM
jgi:methyl coenzyme M reductase gamma subunit